MSLRTRRTEIQEENEKIIFVMLILKSLPYRIRLPGWGLLKIN